MNKVQSLMRSYRDWSVMRMGSRPLRTGAEPLTIVRGNICEFRMEGYYDEKVEI